jgi:hypothetical protein
MKQNTLRIINSFVVAIVASSVNIYFTARRNSIDYQAHPIASITGSIIPGIIAGFAFYLWVSWRAKLKRIKSSSITPQEAVRLATSNIDGQNDDAINAFLRNASARDIQEFILNIHEQSGYIHHARTALDIRLAEDAKITSRRIVHLTWALLVVSVALFTFPFLQMIISKNHGVVKTIANDANTITVTPTAGSALPNQTATLQMPSQTEVHAPMPWGPEYGDYMSKRLAGGLPEPLPPKSQATTADSGFVKPDLFAEMFPPNTATTADVDGQKKLAENGDVIAQWYLGNCYYNGQGVPKDYVEAVKWFRKAADQGYATAQRRLGVCYYDGDGVTGNDAEAVTGQLKSGQWRALQNRPL